jgi:hypothetical protein
VPFVAIVIPTLVSEPIDKIPGFASVALLNISTLLTADPTGKNVKTASPLVSFIVPILGVTIVGDVDPTNVPVPVDPERPKLIWLFVAMSYPYATVSPVDKE